MAATLYGLFSAWLLFPILGVPRVLTTSAAVLVWIEFLAALTWGYTREDCARGSCSPLAEAARSAVAMDLPVLATAVVLLAVAYGVRRWRGSSRIDQASSEGVSRVG